MTFSRARLAGTLILGALASAAFAADGVAYRVKDLRTVPTSASYFLADVAQLPEAAFLLGGWLPGSGGEPWVSDGTTAGTRLLRDLVPGSGSSAGGLLGRAGDRFLFSAWTPATGSEPWSTDGTSAGTVSLGDLEPGGESSGLRALGQLGGLLLFAQWSGTESWELWRSDGTPGGSWRVAAVPGFECGQSWGDSAGHSTLEGLVFFGAGDAALGCELWATDGTAAGTRLVADLAPGSASSFPDRFFAAAGRLYFAADDGAHGQELWVTDGTASGTARVTDVAPGAEGSYPRPLGSANAGLVFTAMEAGSDWAKPYWTDGSAADTVLLAELDAWGTDGTTYGGRVVFLARDAAHGREPWSTDGTPEGTAILADLRPGADSSIWGGGLGQGERGVYFFAFDATWTGALYRTDGTSAGTQRIGVTGPLESILSFADVGGRLVFLAYWWAYCPPHHECDYYEVWTTDDTEPGTHPLEPGLEWTAASPSALVARPGGLVFTAYQDLASTYGRHAFRTDGTEAGTFRVLTESGDPLEAWAAAGPLPGGVVLLSGGNELNTETLWRVDGDLASIVRPVPPGGDPPDPFQLKRIGDLVFFASWETGAAEPWRSDGTQSGSWELRSGSLVAFDPSPFAEAHGRAWFGAENPETGRELWESDGTAAGTRLHDLVPGPLGSIGSAYESEIVALSPGDGSIVYRSGYDLYSWVADASAPSHLTTLSEELGWLWGRDPVLSSFEGGVYFADGGRANGCALWRTDGSAAGTLPLAPIGLGWGDDPWELACPEPPVAFADRLYFTSCEVETGCELWTSDGTGAGTHRFADFEPGPFSFLPTRLTPVGGRLLFSGCRAATGCEPWITDGSVAGTHRAADIAPGARSSEPSQFILSGDLVYFAADDGTGAELWAMPVEVFYDGFESGDTSRWTP